METREHGEVKVDGPVGYLRVPVIHYAHRGVSEYVRKTNRYTDAEMQDWVATGRPFRRRFLVTKTVKNFRKTYWKQQGRLDGMHGLVFCALMAFYKFLLYAKYVELQRGVARGLGVRRMRARVHDEDAATLSHAVDEHNQ